MSAGMVACEMSRPASTRHTLLLASSGEPRGKHAAGRSAAKNQIVDHVGWMKTARRIALRAAQRKPENKNARDEPWSRGRVNRAVRTPPVIA